MNRTSIGHPFKTDGLQMLDFGGVAGCFLHPYQRLDCGCSSEQRIRIMIMPQEVQLTVGLTKSVMVEYTCDAFV